MNKKQYSEFRKDIISGDWILFVPGRAKKPGDLRKKREKRKTIPFHECRFEDPFTNVDEHILIGYPRKKGGEIKSDWDLLVLKNKYPAVHHLERKAIRHTSRFFEVVEGAGHHDLIITRDHKKDFPDLSREQAFRVLTAFRDRYLMLFQDKNIEYVSMFHNWGRGAGASIFHPHYQMMGIPIIPPHITHVMLGADRYAHTHSRCAFCTMIAEEKKQRTRIIAENDAAIAFAPYASWNEFQVKILPKKHSAGFENTLDAELQLIADMLQLVLKKVKKNLSDPDYNFFIHTAPMHEKKKYKKSFHWYIEVIPVYNTAAGFEFDTGMQINVINPDFAARILRK